MGVSMGRWSEKYEGKVKSVQGLNGWTGGLLLMLLSR